MGRRGEECKLAAPGDRDLPEKLSDAFGILQNTERRLALHCLTARSSQPIGVGELAGYIATLRGEGPLVDPDTVELTLRHNHLPRLAEAGVIDYDERTGVVVYHGDPILDCCLDKLEQFDPTPSE